MSMQFLVTTLIVVITPGTGVLYTMATGIRRGAGASVVAAVGCTFGILPHMLAAITGLAALLHTSALAFQILKYLGVAYLLVMAWTMLRAQGEFALSDEAAPRSAMATIGHGVLINLLNPKLTIFFFAFLPQFVTTTTVNPTLQMIGLSAIFMLVTLVVFIGYGVFAAAIRTRIIDNPQLWRYLRRTFCIAFLGLALNLATER